MEDARDMVAKISNASCPRSRIKLSPERARLPHNNSRLEIRLVLEVTDFRRALRTADVALQRPPFI